MVEINNTTKTRIDVKLVEIVAKKFLKHYKKQKFNVSIAFVGDREIQKINKIYRGINKPTDVLSFEGEDDFLGEVIISYSQIKKQAREQGKTAEEELIFILVHGLMHLVGYDDETEEGRVKMIRLGEAFIKALNPKL
jgi:probable rRNA maturation factor